MSSKSAPKITIGCAVDGKFEGSWWPGVIDSLNLTDGEMVICWDSDGTFTLYEVGSGDWRMRGMTEQKTKALVKRALGKGASLSERILGPILRVGGVGDEAVAKVEALFMSSWSPVASAKVRKAFARPGVAKNVLGFYAFLRERQEAWHCWSIDDTGGRKGPYSEDVMMSRYTWCNVYRELDRGTRYFRSQVLDKFCRRRVQVDSECDVVAVDACDSNSCLAPSRPASSSAFPTDVLLSASPLSLPPVHVASCVPQSSNFAVSPPSTPSITATHLHHVNPVPPAVNVTPMSPKCKDFPPFPSPTQSPVLQKRRHSRTRITMVPFEAPPPLVDVLFMSFVYRRANNVSTWVKMGGLPIFPRSKAARKKWPGFKEKMSEIWKQHGTFFADCHIDSGGMSNYKKMLDWLIAKQGGRLGITNIEAIARDIELICVDDDVGKVERIFSRIRVVQGCGDFFSWQITCDLLESHVLPGLDEDEWMKFGPGAISGMERVFIGKVSKGSSRGEMLYKRYSFDETMEMAKNLRDVASIVFESANLKYRAFRGKPISLKNIEHGLCEWSKYCNCWEAATSKGGRAKTRDYKPQEGVGSKRAMDFGSICSRCRKKRKKTTKMFTCATCLGRYCNDCVDEVMRIDCLSSDQGSWQCLYCYSLDTVGDAGVREWIARSSKQEPGMSEVKRRKSEACTYC